MLLSPCLVLSVLTAVLMAALPVQGFLGGLFPLVTPDPYFTALYQPVVVATVRASRVLGSLHGTYRGESAIRIYYLLFNAR